MLHEPELQNIADEQDTAQASKFAMFGERSSGLDYVEDLITLNFPELRRTDEYGWRHGFVNPGYMRDSTVCVAVVRNALDWVCDFYAKPEQVGGWCKDLSLSEFIRHEWSGSVRGRVLGKPNRKLGLSRHEELMLERHPMTGARIRNIIELRSLKLQSLLKLEQMTQNVVMMRYEDVRDAPEEMMQQLQSRLGLPECTDIMRIEEQRDDAAEPAPVSEDDIGFILSELNMPLEEAFGYSYA
ncbi:MAG: hypothetical protein AAGA08_00750 [Pseudomonadota bacterium]